MYFDYNGFENITGYIPLNTPRQKQSKAEIIV